MKFKLVFGLFNAILGVAFLFVFLMPLILIDFKTATGFWGQNWYIILSFLVILAGLDFYFIKNWKLFSFIEKEDWKGLLAHIRLKMQSGKKLTQREIQILANTAILSQKFDVFDELEEFLRKTSKQAISKNKLIIGISYIMRTNNEEALQFFNSFEKNDLGPQDEWFVFFKVFALMKNAKNQEAVDLLKSQIDSAKDIVLKLALLFLMKDHIEADLLKEKRASIVEKNSKSRLRSEIERRREELHIVVVSKMLYEALEWAYTTDQVA